MILLITDFYLSMNLLIKVNKKHICIVAFNDVISKVIISKVIISKVIISKVIISKVMISKVFISIVFVPKKIVVINLHMMVKSNIEHNVAPRQL